MLSNIKIPEQQCETPNLLRAILDLQNEALRLKKKALPSHSVSIPEVCALLDTWWYQQTGRLNGTNKQDLYEAASKTLQVLSELMDEDQKQ
jgi:hypothetical protein